MRVADIAVLLHTGMIRLDDLRPSPDTPESEWQTIVIAVLRAYGWAVAHFRPARDSRGHWHTPVEADGAGFPDLVCVRDRVIFVELKSRTGRLTPEQERWRQDLVAAGAEYHVLKPSDWDHFVAIASG